MWSRSLVLVVALFLGGVVHAQNKAFDFALYAGFGGTQVSGDHLAGYDKVGFTLGGQITTKIGKNSDLGFRLGFANRGSVKQPDEKKGDFTSYTISMNTVDIPVFYRYWIKNWFGYAGVSTGVLLDFKEETHAGPVVDNRPIKSFDFSAMGGLGVLLGDRLSVEVNAGHAFTYFRKYEGNTPFTIRYGKGQYNVFLLFVLACEIGR